LTTEKKGAAFLHQRKKKKREVLYTPERRKKIKGRKGGNRVWEVFADLAREKPQSKKGDEASCVAEGKENSFFTGQEPGERRTLITPLARKEGKDITFPGRKRKKKTRRRVEGRSQQKKRGRRKDRRTPVHRKESTDRTKSNEKRRELRERKEKREKEGVTATHLLQKGNFFLGNGGKEDMIGEPAASSESTQTSLWREEIPGREKGRWVI